MPTAMPASTSSSFRRRPRGRLPGPHPAQVRRRLPGRRLAHRRGGHQAHRRALRRREGGPRPPPDERVRLRQARAKPIVDDLESWLHAQLPKISGKSELAKAIRYALARMRKLRPYLDHGCLEADNNADGCSPEALNETSSVWRDGPAPEPGARRPPRCRPASWEEAVVTLGELVMILDLARQGLTVAAIARRTGHDRKTIRKYIARGLEPPAYKPRATGPSLIQPFEAYLRERTARFPGADRAAPLARDPRARLRGRLLHRHRVPARHPARAAQGVRASLRDPARQAGPGGLRLLQDRVRRRARGWSASSGSSPWSSATAA